MRIRACALATCLAAVFVACSSTSTNESGSGGAANGGAGGNGAGSGQIIHCGVTGVACDPQSETCCYDTGSTKLACAPNGNCTGWPFVCDDIGDCLAANKPGTVCCAYMQFGNIYSSTCQPSCDTSMEQACDPNAPISECPAGMMCKPTGKAPTFFSTCQP